MMKTNMNSSSFCAPNKPSNYDELFMNQSLLFSDSLKDLKNLKTQLYSAAEYFEYSYANDDHKETVVNSLKDYTIKALVNTVDHLGSMTFKVNGLIEEKVEEVSSTQFRFSGIEQRLQTCQTCIDHEGLAQQSLVMETPKHHKRYILSGELAHASKQSTSKYQEYNPQDEDNWKKLKNAVRARNINGQPFSMRNAHSPSPIHTRPKLQERFLDNEDNWKTLKDAVQGPIKNSPQSSMRKGRSPSPTRIKPKHQGLNLEGDDNWKRLNNVVRGTTGNNPQYSMKKARSPSPTLRSSSLQPGLFSFRENPRVNDKRSDSPHRSKFPLLRSGSTKPVLSASKTLIPNRPTYSESSRSSFSRSITPAPSRPTTLNSSSTERKRYPSEPRKSISMRLPADTDAQKDVEHQPSKSKRILKALLSRRKSKKDDVLYSFLDEY